MSLSCTATLHISIFGFTLHLMVWGVEPIVTRQTSWLKSAGVCGVRQTIRYVLFVHLPAENH